MKAFVLGASSGSIGEATAEVLHNKFDMDVVTHDCKSPDPEHQFGWEVPLGAYSEFVESEALVVTVGRTAMDGFDSISKEEIEAVIYGSLTLPLLCAREYVACREDRGGRIVLVGSYAHEHPFTTGTAYCAAKAGIDMAVRTMAWELTDQKYRVFGLHPYHVPGTGMWEQVQEGVMFNKGMTREEADAYAEKDLKMRLMHKEEIGELIGIALTEPTMQWLSGSSLKPYGGTR